MDLNLLIDECCFNNGFKVAFKNIDKVSEEEYQQIRMNWLGASDSSKLLNVNPFPNGKQADLVNEKVYNEVDESIGKKASVRMGKDIEHIILSKVQELFYQYEIIKPVNMYGSERFGLGINFDAVRYDDTIQEFIPIEIKAMTRFGKKHYVLDLAYTQQEDGVWNNVIVENNYCMVGSYETRALEFGIPVYYYTQLQQQMLALNAPYGFLAVMDVENWNVYLFKVYADRDCQEELKLTGLEVSLKIKAIKELKGV